MKSRYPGTRPFSDSPADRDLFFGRTDEAEELLLRVLSVPLLVQFGKSGLGKTSLLQAGLFPRLRKLPYLPVMIRLNKQGDSLLDATLRSMQESCKTENLQFTLGDTSGVGELVTTTILWRDDLLLTPVLVFDQFEELFTLHDEAFRKKVAAEIGALATGARPPRVASRERAATLAVKIILSLREDYLGELEELSASIPALFHERLRLAPFTAEAATEAIVKPATLEPAEGEEPYASPRFRLDPPALASILEYLKGKSGVIEPFQLQLLCRHAESIATRKRGTAKDGVVTLTNADFAGAQTFASVLTNFYRDTLAKIASDSQRRRAARLCEEGLLDDFGHRLMLGEGQILDFNVSKETLETLCSERLLTRERRHESDFFEISHDRLAESIFAARGSRLPKRVRRRMWTAAVVVLVVVLLLSGFYIRSIREERANADRLIAFLLGEQFLGEIRDTGRSSLLTLVKDRIAGSEGVAERNRMNRGLARRNEGDVEVLNGNLAQAALQYQEGLEAFESITGDTAALRELARTHERIGQTRSDQGRRRDSVLHFQAAASAWRRLIGGRPCAAASADCLDLARSLLHTATAKHAMGEANVLAELNEASQIVSDVLFAPPKKASLYADPAAISVLSSLALVRATVYQLEQDAAGAVPLAIEASHLRPQSIQGRVARIAALEGRGSVRYGGEPQKALDDYREAIRGLDELSRFDPNNRIWQQRRAEVQLRISNATAQCYEGGGPSQRCESPESLAEAEAHTLQSLAQFRALSVADRSNVSLQNGVLWALQTHARVVRAKGGRDEEARLDLEEARRLYRANPRNPSDVESAIRFADLSAASGHHRLLDRARQTLNSAAAISKEAEARDQRHYDEGMRLAVTDPAAALREFLASAAAARDVVRRHSADPNAYSRLQLRYKAIAEVQQRLGNVGGENAALNARVNAAQLAAWLSGPSERASDLVEAQTRYARFLDRTDRTSELVILTEQALLDEERRLQGSSPDPGALARLGLDQCRLGEERYNLRIPGWEEAIRSGVIRIETAAERYNNPQYYFGVGLWRNLLADKLDAERPEAARAERRAAIAAYRKALDINPNYEDARREILTLERRLGGRT